MAIDLSTALELARSEREQAISRLHEAEAEVESLDSEIKGLELALARHNGVPTSPVPPPAEARKWNRLARTDAITRVLEESGEPMSPKEITDILHAVGRTDKRKLVAAAIQYLKRENRVHSIGYGQWVPGPPPDVGGAP